MRQKLPAGAVRWDFTAEVEFLAVVERITMKFRS